MTMGKKKSGIWKYIPEGVPCSVIVFGMFTYIGMQMGVPQMLNTIMKTARLIAEHLLLSDGHLCDYGCNRQDFCGIQCGEVT